MKRNPRKQLRKGRKYRKESLVGSKIIDYLLSEIKFFRWTRKEVAFDKK
jgi:hypothetical protein